MTPLSKPIFITFSIYCQNESVEPWPPDRMKVLNLDPLSEWKCFFLISSLFLFLFTISPFFFPLFLSFTPFFSTPAAFFSFFPDPLLIFHRAGGIPPFSPMLWRLASFLTIFKGPSYNLISERVINYASDTRPGFLYVLTHLLTSYLLLRIIDILVIIILSKIWKIEINIMLFRCSISQHQPYHAWTLGDPPF